MKNDQMEVDLRISLVHLNENKTRCLKKIISNQDKKELKNVTFFPLF